MVCPIQSSLFNSKKALTQALDGLYLYHSTCNSPVRDAGPQLKREMIAVAAVALLAVVLRFITRLPPLSIKWGADDWLVAVLAVRQLPLYTSWYNTNKKIVSGRGLSHSHPVGHRVWFWTRHMVA